MINKFCDIDGFPVYVDPYMDDTHIYRGHKQGSPMQFFIVGTKVGNMLYKQYQNKQRRLKLEKLNLQL